MPNESLTLLSNVVSESTDRRAFLARASKLGLVIPAAGALAGCSDKGEDRTRSDTSGAQQPSTITLQNPNSRLDTHDVRSHRRPPLRARPRVFNRSHTVAGIPWCLRLHRAARTALPGVRRRFPSTSRPRSLSPHGRSRVTFPGPTVQCRVGDTVEFTLTNRGRLPHSMDFHAANSIPRPRFGQSFPENPSHSPFGRNTRAHSSITAARRPC